MPPAITITRRLQWMDTDAAGIWHHSTAVRLLEDAEAELHRSLGTSTEVFGSLPRVHVEFDFSGRVAFDDEVTVALSVEALGRTSITYRCQLRLGDRVVAVGRVVGVLVDAEGTARPWPPHVRERLTPAAGG